jgi:hypothetical protein
MEDQLICGLITGTTRNPEIFGSHLPPKTEQKSCIEIRLFSAVVDRRGKFTAYFHETHCLIGLDTAQAVSVADLILESSLEWNINKLKEKVSPLDVEAIMKKTEFSCNGDLVSWAFENNGRYSVRAAYRL